MFGQRNTSVKRMEGGGGGGERERGGKGGRGRWVARRENVSAKYETNRCRL